MYFILTIDTEADNQWCHGCQLTTENVNYWAPFQELCEDYGIRPTYLITSEISSDPSAISFFRPIIKNSLAEVGAHLHPWTTPPFEDLTGLRFNDNVHAFPSDLNSKLLTAKLKVLSEQITSITGHPPTSFRAGRFGFNEECANALCGLGYIVDSSVVPQISFRKTIGLKSEGGPDFCNKTAWPFSIKCENEKTLLEIPVTVVISSILLQRMPSLLPYHQLVEKVTRKLFGLKCIIRQPLWLRPWPYMSPKWLLNVWDEAERQGLPFGVMMFHSSELMPGASPFRPTKDSVDELIDLLRNFFHILRNKHVESVTLSEAAQIYKKNLSLFNSNF
jgi:hypothetical protein